MWYVKHPFDCIVVGVCAVRDGRGPPLCQGPPARLLGQGWGGSSSRTQPFGVLPAARLMSGPRNVENRADWGALFSHSE